MTRHRYLLAYDVSDDKRRAKVFRILSDFGDHVQYSVFICEVNARELQSLRARLDREVHQENDQVLVINLGLADNESGEVVAYIGRPFQPAGRVIVV